jgi:hypothetical protein
MTDTDEIARLRALWCEEKSKSMTFHAEVERLRAERDALKADANLVSLNAVIATLRAEVAALKAKSDPLAEMWEALVEYQPQADKHGHGESWRAMCEKRTHDWVWAAKIEARKASRDAACYAANAAARALAEATEWAVEVIEAIRRAKEAKP